MARLGFEVNTDIAFIDTDWDEFEEWHDRRFGLAIDYVKSTVKGVSHANKVMDLVIGGGGFYAQSKQFPAAFYGDTGDAELRCVDSAEAQEVVWEAVAMYRAGEVQSLTCVYSDAPGDVFFGYRINTPGDPPVIERYEMGTLRTSLPLHVRVMIDAPDAPELLGATQGVLVYQRSLAGKHLLLKAPGRRQPFPLLGGFSE